MKVTSSANWGAKLLVQYDEYDGHEAVPAHAIVGAELQTVRVVLG